MKKVFGILMLLIYGLTSIGATVHIHYCMGKYQGWSLTQNNDDECGKCGMKEAAKKKGCCKDEHKTFKLKTDQQKSTIESDFQIVNNVALLPIQYNCNIIVHFPIASLLSTPNYRPPPNIYNQNLQVLFCSFLI